ncbi:hypothetical protein ACFRKE_03480 [Kitasatospora indigofera]|uniref:hypothetical protein n=1 Tax=Kitasatospora indigofera TaxID=67307 RepID=UPI0036CB16AF
MTKDDLERLLAFLPVPTRSTVTGSGQVLTTESTTAPERVHPPRTAPTLNFDAPVGIAVGHVERLYQQIRHNLLEVRILDREELLRSRTFVQTAAWNEVWDQGASALADPEIRVIIMVAPRGFGSTTLVHHLLARRTPDTTKLVELEPDWPRPTASKLGREPRHAYQLDLKDPQTDRPSAAFLADVAKTVPELKAARSLWVLNVTAELWAEHRTWPTAPGVQVIELRSPPDPQAVVENHLTATDRPWLANYVQSDKARTHLSAVLTTVEAVRAANSVVGQWDEFTRTHPNKARWVQIGPIVQTGRPAGVALDPTLLESIENALGDWRSELDRVFAHTADIGGALSLPDRCLLLSLAVHRYAPAASISRDARALEDVIAKEDRTHAATNLGQVFAGPGLRQRLLALHAAVSPQDNVEFRRPGYDRAVLTYVWDNYEDMRLVLLEWLVRITPTGRAETGGGVARTADVLAELASRHQEPGILTQMRDAAYRLNRPDVCTAVLTRVLANEHMERAAWARLYDWADDRPETQSVVVAVAEQVLARTDDSGTAHRKAMTRLRRVALTSKDRSVLSRVLAVFHDLGARANGRDLLLLEVLRWRERKAPRPGKIALLALMAQYDGGLPWLFGDANGAARTAVDEGLRDLLADPQFEPKAVAVIGEWLETAAADAEAYAALRDRVVPALRGQPSRDAGMALLHRLDRLVLPDGTQLGDDLWASLLSAPRR